jgi:beta-1,4-mannosyltransferase
VWSSFEHSYSADVEKDVMCGEIRFLMGERIPTVDGQFLHVRLNRMNPVLFRFCSAFRFSLFVTCLMSPPWQLKVDDALILVIKESNSNRRPSHHPIYRRKNRNAHCRYCSWRCRKVRIYESSAALSIFFLIAVPRSPRMQYHAASLLEEGHTVTLIGYDGENLIPSLSEAKKDLNVIRFSVPAPQTLRKVLPIYLLLRILLLFVYVFRALFGSIPKPNVDIVLVQNPPAMPLLLVAHLYCMWCGIANGQRPAFVIDWHNLGYTMLANKFFSKIARAYERLMAPYATAHLCVTAAMKSFLETNFYIPDDKISVLHDCPPQMFQPLSAIDQDELLSRLHEDLCAACPKPWSENLNSYRQTLFTEVNNEGGCIPRPGRPALVTSSTSWTPDEDFGQLLDALVGLDRRISQRKSTLKILVVVTGKGPQKTFYQVQISKLKLVNVAIHTLWLEPADYPRLLACADLGVSLHTSTSGIDLPMKVLDLFGCSVPVCARNFDCLSELVQDDVNGRLFETSSELEEQLWSLLCKLDQHESCPPHSFGDLARYSEALKGRRRWSDNWKEHALPVLMSATAARDSA